MSETAIDLKNITVSYLQNRAGLNSIKDFFVKSSLKNPYNRQIILEDISFNVKKGETLGIFGPNGCGKSTLLRVIAGIIKPDKGTRNIYLPLSPLLSLAAGVESELTGFENIKIALILSGNYDKNKAEIIEKVADFSELSAKDLKKPIKTYSSGMVARLAISSILVTNPELLMVDEILSVGDVGFQNKCKYRIQEIISNGATLLFVSHMKEEVIEICERGICINNHNIVFDGDVKDAAKNYESMFI